jgi:hypothetical protein
MSQKWVTRKLENRALGWYVSTGKNEGQTITGKCSGNVTTTSRRKR